MKKDPAEHYGSQRQRSGGAVLHWLEACFRASRENLRALLGTVALEIERFFWLDLLLPPSSVAVGSLVSAGFQAGFETWGQPLTPTGAMRRSRLAFLAQTNRLAGQGEFYLCEGRKGNALLLSLYNRWTLSTVCALIFTLSPKKSQ